jgi:uncharacterized protein (DUF983 family)
MNPFAPPNDATDEQPHAEPLGRNDCPKCSTVQLRVFLINPWHKCRSCGSRLKLHISQRVSDAILLCAVALYLALAFYVTRNAFSIAATFYVACDLGTKLAIGRFQVHLPASQEITQWTVSGSQVLCMAGSLFLLLTTVIVANFIGPALPILFVSGCCLFIFMLFALLFGKRTSQGHLEMSPILKGTRRTLLWLFASVVLGSVIGMSLSK